MLIAGIAGMTWAGDVATMVNLGFSRDSETFAFAQYGIREDSLFPYAEIFIVDVAQNRFVKDGVIRNDYERRVEPGYDGSAA
ncbi:MAG: DUF2259 domain-containing protein, partial [Spirochaetaceae bacterium]